MQVSKWLTWIWGALAAGVVLGLIQGPVIMGVSLVVTVLQLYAVYRLRGQNARLGKAFTCMLAGNAAMVAGYVVSSTNATIGDGAALTGLLTLLGIVLMVATFALVLMGQFQFYWGLDDMIPNNGYAYPEGRIKWCFYFPLIGALAGVIIVMIAQGGQTIINAVLQLPVLWLFWQYIVTVRAKEEV